MGSNLRLLIGKVKVEWQLTSPFDPTADVEGDQEGGEEYVWHQAATEPRNVTVEPMCFGLLRLEPKRFRFCFQYSHMWVCFQFFHFRLHVSSTITMYCIYY